MINALKFLFMAAAYFLKAREKETNIRLYRESVSIKKDLEEKIYEIRNADPRYTDPLAAELSDEEQIRDALGQRIRASDDGERSEGS